MPAGTKQAEKDYLRRSGGGGWESSKPFPPPGQTATDEHARHLLDFSVLLQVLAPQPSDLILDLGAGSCWVSEWLRRCGMRTVAVDIAFDMVRLGSVRLGSTRGLTVGDMEHLPFSSGTFRRACCLNAFHHIPNPVAALREIRRVLTADGTVFFSEPGVGHASHPTSLAASRNYGVLENEILIESFMDWCLEAGFADVRLHPISHVVPLFELNRAQWHDWRTFTRSQRPFRALEKLRRAALELVGLGKKSVLFEEAFAIRLLRELQPVIEQHPVVTAHCSPFVKPGLNVDRAELELVSAPASVHRAEGADLRVRLTNSGSTTWDAGTEDSGVRLGVQLLAADGRVVDRDYHRQPLPSPVLPGGRCELTFRIPPPAPGGTYRLKLDLVREGVRWFETAGSQVLVHTMEVAD